MEAGKVLFGGRRCTQRGDILFGKFYCLRQVHLAENLLQATHTQNREKTT